MASKKYPRTPHLPWSPGGTNDDKRLKSVEHFLNVPTIISEKVDGSNLCLTRDNIFSRSHSGIPKHKSFDMAKAFHNQIKNYISENISIFGEWLYAVHSIEYNNLPSYFLMFGIRNDDSGMFLDWNMTEEIEIRLGINIVPTLFKGIIKTEKELEEITTELSKQKSNFGEEEREGIVIRLEKEFINFDISVAKWVRKNHIKTDDHWINKPIVRNKLR